MATKPLTPADGIARAPARPQSVSDYARGSASRTGEGDGGPEVDPTAVVQSLLKRWWWALLLVVAASGGLAYVTAMQLGKRTATVQASLIHSGLPPAQAAGVYEEVDTNTAAEMLQSVDMMREWADARELGVPPTVLRNFLTVRNPRHSQLMEISLSWANAEDGVEMLNDLMQRFIDRMVRHRREMLAGHIKHVESGLLSVKSEVDHARRQLRDLLRRQQEELDAGGLNSERYRSLLSRVASTQLAIDEKRAQEKGVLQQIAAVEEQAAGIEQSREEAAVETRSAALGAASSRLRTMRERFAKGSAADKDLLALVERIKTEMQATASIEDASAEESTKGSHQSPEDWIDRLQELLEPAESGFSRRDHESMLAELQQAAVGPLSEWSEYDALHTKTKQRVQEMKIGLIPIANETEMLEKRLADYNRQALELGDELTGNALSEGAEFERRVEQAESRQAAIVGPLEAMRELEACRVREWSVSTPASLETTVVDSNRKKLFVLAFGMIGLTLTAPLIITEWNRARATPSARFARAVSVPLIADRVLPYAEADRAPRQTPTHTEEALRMLALRIQQSTNRIGSVVLFSSADGVDSPAPLLAAVADCLAERDERVLVIDAVCPGRSLLTITGLFQQGQEPTRDQDVGDTHALSEVRRDGLSEYLVEDCDSLSDIVRPTGRPGVDLVQSGQAPFPREAMASACLTRLLEEGRDRYSMILVNAPPSTSAADVQMLAARADGIVLTASRRAVKNPIATAAVNELVELGAPIIGVVG